ncbi:PQQ-dependent sugar dehydrogenase [Natronosalvus halobius]|uniref:PQQ-dependent sugar dehydrogenase n=1 Tax=Natronosalvus halobius TaxID=2953746 RepID=UPI00209F814F|nr:PQQ-dependent sugar dehydrogenase [Natronosalvus halobius]USZ71136.1 PQQ-dependent sugar dehydrogenase [Natronosalvus halobius]
MGLLTDRREFLVGAALCATTGIAGCASPSATESPELSETLDATAQLPEAIGLQTTVSGLDAPLAVAFVPGTDQQYVAERDGRVLRHGPNGLQDDHFLDLRDTVETEGEKGLLGMALHPDFPDDRRLFVRYSAPLREGMPEDYSHTFVLAAFEVTGDGTRARRDSERSILEIPQPRPLHNGGDIAFGPDGFLYVSVGDSGESPEEVWYDGPGGGNGQDVTKNLLGSVLRLDVDTWTDDRGYVVPEDNPLVGRDGLDEHYAWGFRNPWRLSFDGEDLYVADVGQNRFEEVNLVEKGGNYGWNVKEGTHCYKTDDCPDRTPDHVRGGEPLRDPIVEYPHEGDPISGVSVIGGYVYRGSALSELDGRYVFGDFIPEGQLFVASPPDDADTDVGHEANGLWPTAALELVDAEKLTRALSFGRDEDGEVYVLGTGSEGGGLFRIVSAR